MKREQIFIGSCWCLLLMGIVFRYSLLGAHVDVPLIWLSKEVCRIGLALLVFNAVSKIPSQRLKFWARPLMIGAILFLLLMELGWAHKVHGASRWIDLGFTSFQPSEFVKVIMLIYLADFLTRHRNDLQSFSKGIIPPIFLMFVTFFLIVIQPDFGTAALLLTVGIWMMLVAGIRVKHLSVIGLLAIPLMGWFVASSDYRMDRLKAWVNPHADISNLGYQVNQSKWAIREGGLLGKGFMEGDARHGYLPESTSDFIVSVWIEEMGLLGFLVMLSFFAMMIWQIFLVSLSQKNNFQRIFVAGIGTLLGAQILINLGVVTGLFPNKGIPLPFVSSGGSSLIATACLLGFVWRILQQSSQSDLCPENEANTRAQEVTRVWNGL